MKKPGLLEHFDMAYGWFWGDIDTGISYCSVLFPELSHRSVYAVG